ncbi:TlpA family protein disulfide reductase [Dactylosporangium sp. CS-047395]|uniref:TlpA family protein disulfide reductase n=1 Tax=Dactylosporangium sp. CS-047395 TaxID=3239936 RepID=UPI003D8EA8C8
MLYLTAAVVILTGLTLLNLLLMLGVIRRLRDHSERFTQLTKSVMPEVAVLAAGSPVPEFAATTRDGDTVSGTTLEPETLLGFFSPSCKPCKAMLPKFADYARSVPGGRERVLAIVVQDADPAEYLALLEPVARVIVEEPGGTVAAAFDVSGFPAVCLIGPDGTVAASGMHLQDLPRAKALAGRG